jgi:hypothetical protein
MEIVKDGENSKKEPLLLNEMRLVKTATNVYAITRNNYYLECHQRSGEVQIQQMVNGKIDLSPISDADNTQVKTIDHAKMCTSKCPLFQYTLEKVKNQQGEEREGIFVYNRCGFGAKYGIVEVVIEKK